MKPDAGSGNSWRDWVAKVVALAATTVACFAFVVAPSSARAADGTWSLTNNNGSWVTQGNWVGNVIPGSTTATDSTDTAWFSALLTAARTVTVDSNRNIQNITFDGGNSSTFGYTLSGGSLLLTSGGTISSTGSLGAHTDTISAPMTIVANNGTYRINNDSTLATRLLTISGSIFGQSTTGTTTLYLGGNNSGTNTLSGQFSSGTGGGRLAIVKDGSSTWQISSERIDTTAVTVNSGTVLFGTTSNLGLQQNLWVRTGSE